MITLRSPLVASSIFLALAMAAPVALAVPTVYFGLDNADLSGGGARPNAEAAAANFSAAAGATAVQDFESFAPGAVPASFDIDGTTASFTNSASQYAQISSGVGTFSTFAISGSKYLESLSLNGTTYFTIAFDHGVSALSFYITDASDWFNTAGPVANLQVVLHQGSGDVVLDLFGGLDAATVNNGNVAFFGVVDMADPINGFSIANPASIPNEDAIGIDDLRVSAIPVPAPATGYLTATGLLAIYRERRRRAC